MFPSSSLIPMYILLLGMKPIRSFPSTSSVLSPKTDRTAPTRSNPWKYSVNGSSEGVGEFLFSLTGTLYLPDGGFTAEPPSP